jgi:hypothetical protein
MPRGVDYRIPLTDLFECARAHELGWSLRALARLRWRKWGYASDKSALEGLRAALRSIDAPVRDRIEATVLASTVHGNSPRAAHKPDHPDHDRYLAQRRHVRKLKREALR